MRVDYSKRFKKQYQKLPRKTQKQFEQRLKLLLSEPASPLLRPHKLVGAYKGYVSINVTGDIRAIFTVKEKKTIYFIAIGLHSELYS